MLQHAEWGRGSRLQSTLQIELASCAGAEVYTPHKSAQAQIDAIEVGVKVPKQHHRSSSTNKTDLSIIQRPP